MSDFLQLQKKELLQEEQISCRLLMLFLLLQHRPWILTKSPNPEKGFNLEHLMILFILQRPKEQRDELIQKVPMHIWKKILDQKQIPGYLFCLLMWQTPEPLCTCQEPESLLRLSLQHLQQPQCQQVGQLEKEIRGIMLQIKVGGMSMQFMTESVLKDLHKVHEICGIQQVHQDILQREKTQ